MKLFLDGSPFLESDQVDEISARLMEWKNQNNERSFYLFEYEGNQFSFVDGWEDFLINNAKSDREVRITTATPEELLLELVGSTKEYIDRLKKSAGELAEKFYASPDQETWRLLADFIEGLNFVFQAVPLINPSFDKEQFRTMLQELLEAMQNKDTITLADLLNYEWVGWLSALQQNYFEQ